MTYGECMYYISILALLIISSCKTNALDFAFQTKFKRKNPNIVIVSLKDLGVSDIGMYGGDINTPNIDYLIENGVLLTRHYSTANTETDQRAILFANQNDEAVCEKSLVSMIREHGYKTYHIGNWDLNGGKYGSIKNCGFQQYFSQINDEQYNVNGRKKIYVDMDYDFYQKLMTKYIASNIYSAKPFFMYANLNSPNENPIKDDNSYRSKYEKSYQMGYEELSRKRYKRIKTRNRDIAPSKLYLDKNVPKWNRLSEQERDQQIEMMVKYSSSVDQLDHNLGKLMNYLQSLNELNNTIIILSASNSLDEDEPQSKKNHWNQLTDFKKTKKGSLYEGSLRSTAIVYYPDKIKRRKIVHNTTSLENLLPSVLKWTSLESSQYEDYIDVAELSRKDKSHLFTPLSDNRKYAEDIIFASTPDNTALIKGNWKIIKTAGTRSKWMLVNTENDISESKDYSSSHPKVKQDLIDIYNKQQQAH